MALSLINAFDFVDPFFYDEDFFVPTSFALTKSKRKPNDSNGDVNKPTQGFLMDLTEDNKTYKLHCDLPGVKMEDIDISISKNILTVKGHREYEYKNEEGESRKRTRIERSYGSYTRSIKLPKDADQTNPTATLTSGVLEITIPKKTEELPQVKKIMITSNSDSI